jgi:hypothetical protein
MHKFPQNFRFEFERSLFAMEEKLAHTFREKYKRDPILISYAPGRVEVLGTGYYLRIYTLK